VQPFVADLEAISTEVAMKYSSQKARCGKACAAVLITCTGLANQVIR
jgi:hypothetical protein